MTRLTLTRPDDWHLHLRDEPAIRDISPASAAQFKRAMVMPNLKPPIRTVKEALAYRSRILDSLPDSADFQPLMTIYLTEHTKPEEIACLKSTPHMAAVKYYPAGATTNSEFGVTDIRKVHPVLEAMQQLDVPLLMHGETIDPAVDVFEREQVFIHHVLAPLLDEFPKLRAVLEHITTVQAVDYVLHGEDRLAATVTAHHLLMNRNALFQGGIRPHHYCLPVLKREEHRQRLLYAVSTGSPRFFLGTDSAPHSHAMKECAFGCAGVYTAPAALPLYAEAFEEAGALDKLEAFASFYGADFHRLPRNTQSITLEKRTWRMPEHFPLGDGWVTPLRAKENIHWQVIAEAAT